MDAQEAVRSERTEQLAREFHAIYQLEAKRQAGLGLDQVRHPDDYNALPERTKDYDRVLARYVLTLIDTAITEATRREREALQEVLFRLHAEHCPDVETNTCCALCKDMTALRGVP